MFRIIENLSLVNRKAEIISIIYKVEAPIEKFVSCLQEVIRQGESDFSLTSTGAYAIKKYSLTHAHYKKGRRINITLACNHFLASARPFSMADKRFWLCCFLLLGLGESFFSLSFYLSTRSKSN